MSDDDALKKLRPALVSEVEQSLCFALRYAGRRRVHHVDEVMAQITAERLVEHLQQSGFVILKRSLDAAPTSSGHPQAIRPPESDQFREDCESCRNRVNVSMLVHPAPAPGFPG